MQVQAQGLLIPSVSLSQRRDAAAGIHPNAYRRHEERTPEQHPNPLALDANPGLTAAEIAAQCQVWRQEQLQTEQAVADGEAQITN